MIRFKFKVIYESIMESWSCLVCAKPTYVKLLECCQSKSESKYAMCKACVDQCEICPICRSLKVWTKHEIMMYASDMEFEQFKTVNLYFAVYKYLTDHMRSNKFSEEDMLSKLVELDQEVLLPIDILPYEYNIELIDT